MSLSKEAVNRIEEIYRERGFDVAVDCLILNQDKKIFAQKRAPERRLYPNAWDFAGGHIDPGEDLWQSMHKEVAEETAKKIESVDYLFDVFDWTVPKEACRPGENPDKVILQFVVTLDSIDNIILEEGKAVAFDWFDLSNAEILKEGKKPGHYYSYDTIIKFLNSNIYKELHV